MTINQAQLVFNNDTFTRRHIFSFINVSSDTRVELIKEQCQAIQKQVQNKNNMCSNAPFVKSPNYGRNYRVEENKNYILRKILQDNFSFLVNKLYSMSRKITRRRMNIFERAHNIREKINKLK
jgi:hypothetical protein